METTGYHNLNDLFAQLGLDSEDTDIEDFLARHQLSREDHLAQAPFWNEGQREFLEKAILEDSDWCEAVDELDSLLRH